MPALERRRRAAAGTAAALLAGLCAVASEGHTHTLDIGSLVGDFRVEAMDETPFSLAESRGTHRAVVVVFLSTVCPYSRFFARHLRELHARYGKEGVAFLGVDSNRNESAAEMVEYVRRYGPTFPMVKDTDRHVAGVFDARVTPEAFLVDAEGRLRYRGRIGSKIGGTELKDALEDVLAGRKVRTPSARAFGCSIPRE